jgi:calcineurin-like phosphoesterase family protein
MARARTALLICAVALALAGPAAAQAPAATYVVLGAQGPVARAVIPAGTTGLAPACPAIVVDGNSQTMSLRAGPDGKFPILVCEFAVGSATSATIGGQPLPLPPAKKLKSIAAFGDTGCRLKADKNAALAARDTDEADEVEENGKFQDCNDPDDWPFAPMSATIAKAKPDIVVHVGDYLYRESACPSGDQGCQGSPHGDNWETWAADFFTPAAPLLQAAPWIVVRGNHEICKRAGIGYARLLDPAPANGTPPACVDLIDQYTVTVGDRAFIVLDSSDAPDDCPNSGCDSKAYEDQFKAMKPAAGTWLVTHRPIWGFTNSKGDLGIRNMTLQAALEKWDGVPPKGINLVLSGHIHLWEALSFADGRSPQFVLGDGSTKLAHKISEQLTGEEIGGTTVAAAATEHRFGYTMFKPSKKGTRWNATFYDTTGKAKLACKVRASKATCKKASS